MDRLSFDYLNMVLPFTCWGLSPACITDFSKQSVMLAFKAGPCCPMRHCMIVGKPVLDTLYFSIHIKRYHLNTLVVAWGPRSTTNDTAPRIHVANRSHPLKSLMSSKLYFNLEQYKRRYHTYAILHYGSIRSSIVNETIDLLDGNWMRWCKVW